MSLATSQMKYRRGEIPWVNEATPGMISDMGTAFVQRATRAKPMGQQQERETALHPSRRHPQEPQRQEPAKITQMSQHRWSAQAARETYDDEDAKGARTTRPPTYGKPSRRTHPLLWVGLTLLGLCLFWITTTIGTSFWVTHFCDPGQFGPLHGSIVTAVFGGGDSAAQPSKLIGWNDAGHIRLIVIHAGDASHSQILTGPNLLTQDWPDPTQAQVQLETSDTNHDGCLDVRIHLLSTTFDAPLHRAEQPYTLYGDGKGNIKPEPPQPCGGAS